MFETKITSIEDMLKYCKQLNHYLFYIGPMYRTSVVRIHPFITKFEIITCSDPFYGTYPFIKIPQFLQKEHQCGKLGQCGLLAKNKEIIDYIKRKDPNAYVMLAANDTEINKIYKQNGLKVFGISSKLFHYLDNKVEIIKLLTKASIPFIPNICSKIKNYQDLLEISSNFGSSKLVIQDQQGFGGIGTMFISNKQDYNTHKQRLENGKQFKIMRQRRLKCFAIVGVATRSGAIMGPLFSELIGHQKLTPYLGGYCGNQLRYRYFQDYDVQLKVRSQIYQYAQKFVNFLYSEGFLRGTFGCDFSVDIDTNEVFFMQINPRLTGSTTLSFQLYQAQGYKFPIILYHILEYLQVKLQLDIKSINNEWLSLEHYKNQYSHIMIRSFNKQQASIPFTIPAAIWKIQNGKIKSTIKNDLRISQLKQGQIYYGPSKGLFKLNLAFKGSIQDYNFKLTQETNSIVDQCLQMRLKDRNHE